MVEGSGFEKPCIYRPLHEQARFNMHRPTVPCRVVRAKSLIHILCNSSVGLGDGRHETISTQTTATGAKATGASTQATATRTTSTSEAGSHGAHRPRAVKAVASEEVI